MILLRISPRISTQGFSSKGFLKPPTTYTGEWRFRKDRRCNVRFYSNPGETQKYKQIWGILTGLGEWQIFNVFLGHSL